MLDRRSFYLNEYSGTSSGSIVQFPPVCVHGGIGSCAWRPIAWGSEQMVGWMWVLARGLVCGESKSISKQHVGMQKHICIYMYIYRYIYRCLEIYVYVYMDTKMHIDVYRCIEMHIDVYRCTEMHRDV